jgi:hypothetical protein
MHHEKLGLQELLFLVFLPSASVITSIVAPSIYCMVNLLST